MEVVIAIGIALMIMYFVVRWVLIKKGKMQLVDPPTLDMKNLAVNSQSL